MDIKFFSGDKEIIMPEFDVRFNEEKEKKCVLLFCIHNYSNEEQDKLLYILKKLKKNDLYINSDYIAIINKNEIYLFDLTIYKDNKFENTLVSGYYNFGFAFIDKNDKIINKDYLVMELNGHPIKQL